MALVIVPVFGYIAFEQFLRIATLGPVTPDLLLLYPTDRLVHVIAWTAAGTLLVTFGLIATAKSWLRLILFALLVPSAGVSVIVAACYLDFVAIRASGGALADGRVVLVYLWPRPEISLDPRGAVVALETVLNNSDESVLIDRIIIERDGRSYRSAPSGAAKKAQQFLISRGARAGEARRAR